MPPPPPSAIVAAPLATDENFAEYTPDILTLMGISERRARSVFKGGIASAGFSDAFKGKPDHRKPKSKDFTYRLTEESKSRMPSPLKSAALYLSQPGMISLCGGLPSADYFPFSHIDLGVPTGKDFSEEQMLSNPASTRIGKHDMREGKSQFDLAVSLNYGQGTGFPQLVRWCTEHTEIVHNPPYQDWGCVMTVGSTSALDMCLRTFLNHGDYLIADEYSFSSAIETTHGMCARLVGIEMDDEGLIPSKLDDMLANWDEKARGAKRPFLLYQVPTGQNPCGCTQSLARRREIYNLARKWDLLVIEDEPYYFLQMTPYQPGSSVDPSDQDKKLSHDAFLKNLMPSYLSFDTDGRVIRLDSFSKVVAPGARCGWLTANAIFCERFARHNEVTVQAPSGFAQVILYKLLDEYWGHSGYIDWLMHIRREYSWRRNLLMGACEKYLPTDVTSWVAPMAGMFLWIKVHGYKHKDYKSLGNSGIEEAVFMKAVESNVLVGRGSWFYADANAPHKDMFVRVTFAAAQPDQMIEAMRRLGTAIRTVFGLPQLPEVADDAKSSKYTSVINADAVQDLQV